MLHGAPCLEQAVVPIIDCVPCAARRVVAYRQDFAIEDLKLQTQRLKEGFDQFLQASPSVQNPMESP